MARDFVEFQGDLDRQIRERLARDCRFAQGRSPEWGLRGAKLAFYQNAWLAFVAPHRDDAEVQRRYFVVDLGKRGRKPRRLIPIANAAGSIDRVNRELRLKIGETSLIDYLNFYYAFTPKEDTGEGGQPVSSQFAVPMDAGDIVMEATAAPDVRAGAGLAQCDERCLALGAVWHYLDPKTHGRFIARRFRRKKLPYFFRVTARLSVQLHNALFAVDVKVPELTGTPALSNIELLYQGALTPPHAIPATSLPQPDWIARKEFWRRMGRRAAEFSARLVRRAGLALSWTVTALFAYLWGLSAAFPILEMFEIGFLRRHLEWLSGTLGLEAWPATLARLTIIALVAFLLHVYYLTSADKMFNWILWVCPKRWEKTVERILTPRLEKHDRDLIAQDTFRKRALLALRLLVFWTAYAVLAFASLQIATNITESSQQTSATDIVGTLMKQAAINVPLIAYFMLRLPDLFGSLDPVGQHVLSTWVLLCFQLVMAGIILKGIYRVWVFTKEASPNAFYRKLIYPKGKRQH
jgi:hypothetical protein